jgi:hypothetical protein
MTEPKMIDLLPDTPLMNDLLTQLMMMGWAQDEIDDAQARHGETGHGPIFNVFPYLKCVEQEYMNTETIFRAHCREMCDRAAAGQDLRPGTDAEMIGALKNVSTVVPLAPAHVTLYFRIAARSFPEIFKAVMTEIDLEAYESVHGSAADDVETLMRKKLTRNRD